MSRRLGGHGFHRVVGAAALAACVAGGGALLGMFAQGELQRTVYVTAWTGRDAYVPDLGVADLDVKEAGKTRSIVRVQPSNERLRVAVVVDELLAPNVFTRQAVVGFVQRLNKNGDLSLHLVGQRNETRVDYTSELNPFVSALNAFPVRAAYPGNLVFGLMGILKLQRPLEGRRAVVVLAPEVSQTSSVTAEGVFDELRASGAVFHAVTFVAWRTSGGTLQEVPATRLEGGSLTDIVERDRVLNDGPKLSGGLHVQVTRAEDFASGLDRVANALLREFRVTYTLPAGTQSDGRVSIESKKRGLSVRGPSRVPEIRD